jgi:hypothetical protein
MSDAHPARGEVGGAQFGAHLPLREPVKECAYAKAP